MRRSDREITNYDEIVDAVRRCDICRIAMFDKEYPYVIPLNFGYKLEDDNAMTIYFHGAKEGKKHDLLSKNNHVGFEMDMSRPYQKCSLTTEYESIVGSGHMEVVHEESEKVEAHRAIMSHYGDDAEITDDMVQDTLILRLNVKHITGKRNLR